MMPGRRSLPQCISSPPPCRYSRTYVQRYGREPDDRTAAGAEDVEDAEHFRCCGHYPFCVATVYVDDLLKRDKADYEKKDAHQQKVGHGKTLDADAGRCSAVLLFLPDRELPPA